MFLGELAEHSACDDTTEGGYQAISVGEQGVDVDSGRERCVNVRCDVLRIKYEQKLAIEYIVTVDKKNQKVITFRNTDRKENTNNTKQPIKITRKTKIWTKLKNGLYGWRVSRTVTNNQVKPKLDILVEQVSLSARAGNKLQSKYSNISSSKRKLSLGGGYSESESFAGTEIKKAKT